MSAPDTLGPGATVELSPQVDDLVPEWEDLARSVGAGFAARPSFALGWWETHGRGRLAVAATRRAGRLVAVAPLHRRRVGGRAVLRWLGHGEGVLGEIVALDPAASRAMWSGLLRAGVPLQLARTRLSGLLALRRVHAQEPVGSLRISAVGHGRVLKPTDVLGDPSADRRPTSLSAAVELLTDQQSLRGHWTELGRLQGALSVDRQLLERAAAAGDLVVAAARVEGRCIAAATMLRRGRELELWSLSAARPDDRVAVGDLLVRAVLDRAGDLAIDGLDLAVGGAELESAWSGETYDVATLLAGAGPLEVAALGVLQAVEDGRRRRATA